MVSMILCLFFAQELKMFGLLLFGDLSSLLCYLSEANFPANESYTIQAILAKC